MARYVCTTHVVWVPWTSIKHMQCSAVRRCRYVSGIAGIWSISRGSEGIWSSRESSIFRLYKVVSEAILDHSMLILTLK